MKPVFQCDWCDERGTEEVIRKHEENCSFNKSLRACHTCGYRKGFGFNGFQCQNGKNIPEGKYMKHCKDWIEDGSAFDASNPYTSIFDCFFGKPPKSKE